MSDPIESPILRRDRQLNELLRQVSEHPIEAREAMKRLEQQAEAEIDRVWKLKRDASLRRRQMLEVAAESLGNPDSMYVMSEIPKAAKPGWHEALTGDGRKFPRWMHLVCERTGTVDPADGPYIAELKSWLECAKHLGFPGYLRKPLRAYFIARNYAFEGKVAESEISVEIDEELVQRPYWPTEMLLFNVLRHEMHSEPSKPRTNDEWWELTLLFLFVHKPDFDGSQVGSVKPLAWKVPEGHQDFGYARFQYRNVIDEHRTERTAHELLLARTTENLAVAVVRLPVEPARKAVLPEGYIRTRDAQVKYGVPRGTLHDYTKKWLSPEKIDDPHSNQRLLKIVTLELLLRAKGRLD